MLIGFAFLFLFSLLVLLAGLWYLNHASRENAGMVHRIAAYTTITVALLVILGLVIGGVCKMACHGGCHSKGKSCNKEMSHCKDGDAHCGKMDACPMMKGHHSSGKSCGAKGQCGDKGSAHCKKTEACSGASMMMEHTRVHDTLIEKEINVTVKAGK